MRIKNRLFGFGFIMLLSVGVWAQPPQITVNPPALNFGSVLVNSDSTMTLSISNTGGSDLVVGVMTILGTHANQFQIVSGPTPPFTIIPGANPIQISLRFRPTFFGNKFANLQIISNDPNQDTLNVFLSGVGVEPNISASTDTLIFGNVKAGQTLTKNLQIFNLGGAHLLVNNLTISGVNQNRFSIINPPALPVTIPPGGAPLTLQVQFAPTAMGDREATLEIASNDPDQGLLRVELRGTGASPAIAVNPTSLNFGNVSVGLDSVMMLEVANIGNDDLVLNSYTFIGPNLTRFTLLNPPTFPVTIPAGDPPLMLEVIFAAASVGPKSAFLLLFNNTANQNPVNVPLSANGVVSDIAVSDTLLDFGTTLVGSEDRLNLVISNVGVGKLVVDSLSVTGVDLTQFAITGGPQPPFSIAGGGGSVTVELTFSPTSTGIKNAFMFILSNDPDENPLFIALTGEGVEPNIVSTRSNLNFGNLLVGSDGVLSFYLKNTGDADLIVSNTNITGTNPSQFSVVQIVPPLPLTIPVGNDSALVSVQFSPTSVGAKEAVLEIVSNDPDDNPLEIPLFGAGVLPEISAVPNPLPFSDVEVGDSSSRVLTIRNAGGAPLTVTNAAMGGTHAGLFRVEDIPSFPVVLPPNGGNFSVNVIFIPDSVGSKSAFWELASDDPNHNPFQVALTGRGISPSILASPPTLDFGNVRVEQDSVLTVLLSNDGSATLIISGGTIGGVNAGDFSFEREVIYPITIPPGSQPVPINLRFTPSELGVRNAVLQISSNDPETPLQDVPLEGVGVLPDIAVAADTIDFGPVVLTTVDTMYLDVINEGGMTLLISEMTVRGDDAGLFAVGGMPAYPLAVPPGDTLAVPLLFAPDSLGVKNAALTIVSDDPDETELVLALTGSGVLPEIAFSGDVLAFGVNHVGGEMLLPLTISNVGFTPLTVSDIRLLGSDAGHFALVDTPATPLVIPEGGAPVEFSVSFSPTSRGIKIATLQVISNDPDDSPFNISLRGRGVAAPAFANILLGDVRFNTELPVSASVTADTTIESVLLWFAAPDQPFGAADTLTTTGDGVYSGTIPAAGISAAGLRVMLEVTDHFSFSTAETRYPAVTVPENALTYSFDTNQRNRWQMFSLPYQLSESNSAIAAVLADLGSEGDYAWRIYRSDSSGINSNYYNSAALAARGSYGRFEPGNAFWLYVRNDNQGGVPAYEITFPEMNTLPVDTFVYRLQPGWNQVGSPFAFEIEWDQVTSAEKDSLEVYSWGGQNWGENLAKLGWTPRVNANFTMAPYGGYYIHNRTSQPVDITFHPTPPGGAPAPFAKSSAEEGWQIELVAETERSFDINIAGMNGNASAGKDRFDFPNPPPVETEFVSLHFRRDWNGAQRQYSSDFRPLNPEGDVWYFTVNSSRRQIAFYLKGMEALPGHFVTTVFDAKYRLRYDLRALETVTLRDLSPDEENRFVLLAGTAEFVENALENVEIFRPADFQLLQNYPNPFNPETYIRYQLAVSGQIRIDVFNVLGQRVNTLVDGFQEAGYYEMRWDGRSQAGVETGSGVYFYRLKAGNFTQTKKMLKLK